MVLQQGKAVHLGQGRSGATLKVSFAGQEKETPVNADSTWILSLDPMEASFEPILTLQLVKESLNRRDSIEQHPGGRSMDLWGQSIWNIPWFKF